MNSIKNTLSVKLEEFKGKNKKYNHTPEIMIAYTDGGAKPNPGHAGWGCHTHLITIEETGKNEPWLSENWEMYANTYAMDKPLPPIKSEKDKALKATIKPSLVIDLWQGIEDVSTNNVGELQGAIVAMEMALELDVKFFCLVTDSYDYVVKGLKNNLPKWKANGWCRSDGKEIANPALWMRAEVVLSNLISKGINISIVWVNGHVGISGNEKADILATRGRIESCLGCHEPYITIKTGSQYGKAKLPNYNRMLNQSCYYLLSGRPTQPKSKDGRWVYHCGKHGKDDNWWGKRQSEACHSVVFLKEQDPNIEKVRLKQNEVLKHSPNSPVIIKLSKVFSSKYYAELNTYNTKYLEIAKPKFNLGLITLDKTALTVHASPPILAYRAMDSLKVLETKLEEIICGTNDNNILTDITDKFYRLTDGDKPKLEINPDFTQVVNAIEVKVNYVIDGGIKNSDLILSVGLEIPARNALSKLAKFNPSIHVVTWPESKNGFRYAVLIKTNDDIGIWTLPHANLRPIEG